jgi:hypothetical protein
MICHARLTRNAASLVVVAYSANFERHVGNVLSSKLSLIVSLLALVATWARDARRTAIVEAIRMGAVITTIFCGSIEMGFVEGLPLMIGKVWKCVPR